MVPGPERNLRAIGGCPLRDKYVSGEGTNIVLCFSGGGNNGEIECMR